jgi:mRNA interferase RelE/StbE
MLDYKISPKAEKYIKKIKDKELKDKFRDAIKEIRENPAVGTLKKAKLGGIRGYDLFHQGVNYEIAYEIVENDGIFIIIILAGTRENFYAELEKYIKNRRKDLG